MRTFAYRLACSTSILGVLASGRSHALAQPTFRGIGFLPGAPPETYPHAVSSDGSTVVGETVNEAFRWTEATGVEGLGFLAPPFQLASIARAVSGDGSVIVGASIDLFHKVYPAWAFYWNADDGLTQLARRRETYAAGITPDGRTIVGGGFNPAGQSEGFIVHLGRCVADFDGSSSITSQDFFDFLNAFFLESPAADVNNDGAVDSQDFFDFLTAFLAGC